MIEDLEQLKSKHIDTYKKAILENINNNTKTLVDDIKLLMNKPPLDSMDQIKKKFIDLAKRNKIVLDTEELDKVVSKYRKNLIKSLDSISKIRIDTLIDKLNKYDLSDDDVIVYYKKDFININKNIKKIVKDSLVSSLKIMEKLDKVFSKDVEEDIKNKIIEEVKKYLKGSYQRQLLDNLDIKILVKDTTLINGINEQTERYLFTLKNSRLLNLD
mgnify:CR=1 FL=1